ncbi:hypothetical protein ACHQM5_028807 [Ranunculus cassubicifolius]
MFKRLFGKPKQQPNALVTIEKLRETLDTLEKKESVFQKKASAEVENAKAHSRSKNKKAAIQCLKRKRRYEEEMEKLAGYQLRIHDQIILLESANVTTDVVLAMKKGADTMKDMQKAMNINNVDETLDAINEQTENMKQIQEALSAPISDDFDEEELDIELQELDTNCLEEDLLQPATTAAAPAGPVDVPPVRQPTAPAPQKKTAEWEEMAAIAAEMAF